MKLKAPIRVQVSDAEVREFTLACELDFDFSVSPSAGRATVTPVITHQKSNLYFLPALVYEGDTYADFSTHFTKEYLPTTAGVAHLKAYDFKNCSLANCI